MARSRTTGWSGWLRSSARGRSRRRRSGSSTCRDRPGAARRAPPGRRDPRRHRRLLSRRRSGPRSRDARARAARRRPRPRRAAARAGREAGEVGRRGAPQGGRAAAGAPRAPRGRPHAARLRGELPPELEPLTTKPLLAVENGPGGIDLQLEAELAELSDEEAADFREGASALDEVVRRLHDALDLITFFTAGEKETRAWTLRRGQTALEAAASIHSDIARASSAAR